jgi:HSP20 family protein
MTFLTRYRPLEDVFTLPRQIDRWMNEALGSIEWGGGESLRQWLPATDVSETPEALVLRLEVPGLSREDLKISVERNILTVRGEKEQEVATENETFHRTERSYGSFERSFSLPSHVDADDVKAALKAGVLTLRLPRREEARAREITIDETKVIEG